jgi:ssDNA thymidine ADP-ribosyltransferase, DarT
VTVSDEIARREIREVLHFTTNRGVVGTLAAHALMSRHQLPREKYLEHVLHLNAANRPEAAAYFDKSQNWLDYVNLSISETNSRYLNVSRRWHVAADVWWAILAFDSQIMTHEGVVFATTNNSYELCSRESGLDGLLALFAPQISRKPTWRVGRGLRPQNLTTCEQAEVLYPGRLSTEYLRKIYVGEEDHHDLARGWLREFGPVGVHVVISAEKFLGRPN